MSDTLNDARIQVGWKLNADTDQIVEVTPQTENKWHRSQSSFMAPSSAPYQVSYCSALMNNLDIISCA